LVPPYGCGHDILLFGIKIVKHLDKDYSQFQQHMDLEDKHLEELSVMDLSDHGMK
jgi:hypothetical protein